MYIALGAVVLVVGVIAVIGMREGDSQSGELVISGGPTGVPLPASEEIVAGTTTVPPRTIYVQVIGAVRRPGVYEVAEGSRVFQAVERAGGFTAEADAEAVPLAAQVVDGCRIHVPRKGEPSVAVSGGPLVPAPVAPGSKKAPVSINSSGLEELDSLPGIGPATAQKIIDHREAKGPFTSVDQLGDVPGIGPAKLEKIRPLVRL